LTFRATGKPIQDFFYSYDLAGNITVIDEHTPNCGIASGPGVKDGTNSSGIHLRPRLPARLKPQGAPAKTSAPAQLG